MKILKRVCDVLLVVIVLCVVVIFAIQLMGYKLVVIQTGSMLPELEIGELCLVREVEDSYDIHKGNIITYMARDNETMITHRVIDLTKDGTYMTKGDNNNVADEHYVEPKQVVGVVSKSAHKLGYLIQFFNSIQGKIVTGMMIVFCVVVGCLEPDKKKEKVIESSEEAE